MATKTQPSADIEEHTPAAFPLVLPYQLVVRQAHERALRQA